MPKISILSAENMTLGTGNVLAAFQTAAAGALAANVFIKRLEISQSGSTTLAAIRGDISTRTTAGTFTLTATTPNVVHPVGGAASGLTGNTAPAGGTARSGTNSSADATGTYTTLYPFNFANTAGMLFKPDPDEQIWIPPSTLCTVRLLATPGTTTGWTVSLWLLEE